MAGVTRGRDARPMEIRGNDGLYAIRLTRARVEGYHPLRLCGSCGLIELRRERCAWQSALRF